MNYVRNICAHHSRLWNRDLNIVPEKLLFSRNLVWISNPDTAKRSKIYYFFCMINYMLQVANPTSQFKSKLKELFEAYRNVISLDSMGFPMGWVDEKMWED